MSSSFTRRAAFGLGLAGAACASLPEQQGLNAIAQTKGMRFGSAISARGSGVHPRYRDIVRAECGVLVAENEHKWPQVEPRPGAVSFAAGDSMVDWAAEHGIAFRGHTLVWHHPDWLPRWLANYDFGPQPAIAAEQLLRTHINQVCAHYRGVISSWDVVNESVNNETGDLRETVFTRHLGPDSNDIMFRLAREALPDAQLVYNDYMGWGGGDATHRNGVLRLLERFRANNTPVDALGLQSHIGPDDIAEVTNFSAQERTWRAFLDEVTGMGYALLITELDVGERTLPADAALRDAAMASYLRGYLDVTLSYSQLKDVLVWGLVDRFSWLQGRWPRDDHLPKRPCLYDADFQPKPMRDAVAAAFRAAPHR
jgi:endo-1,4-beta-xylanase